MSDLFFSELLRLGLLWLWVTLHAAGLSNRPAEAQRPSKPATPPPQRSRDPQPFPGLIHRPPWAAGEQTAQAPAAPPPPAPPPPIISSRGRPRQVETSQHCCPNPDCGDPGRGKLGHLRANGHPGGGPWRQLHGTVWDCSFLETHGTPFPGQRVAPELLVWAVGALADGLGIRAGARVCEGAPNTVLAWLVEAAAHCQAFSRHVLHDVHVTQVQLDELFALLSAGKDGEVTETEAIPRLSRSPHWVWVAMDPVTKLRLAIDVGDRTVTMAQGVLQHLTQVLAPDGVPLCLPDGFREYMTALLTHYGQWAHPARRYAPGPAPKPRWRPRPQLLYAQVGQRYQRRRLVGRRPRVVFGTLEAMQQGLAPHGGQSNTAFVERLHLDLRPPVAAIGRRVHTVGKHEEGLRQQVALCHPYHHFGLPHPSLRGPLATPEPTNGTGAARQWRPRSPAMAAGLTDRVWTLRAGLLSRVPPWPQPQVL